MGLLYGDGFIVHARRHMIVERLSRLSQSTNDIWWDGFDAYKRGRLRHTNPYPKGTIDHITWDSGWLSGDTDAQLNEEDDLRPW